MFKMILTVVFILFTGISGPPLIKYGSMRELNRIAALTNGDLVSIFYLIINPYIFLGLVMYFVSAMLWIIILSKYDLSFVSPMLAINYVFSLFIGYYIFSEDINIYRIIGAIIVTFGVVLITAKG
ncbi:EamA family transporter [Paenibacillus cremeus]|uniref:EamA family transporter n=1 Tax=Paenibacillus cremeus TaxID=2163881 RepID=A0A559KCG2_9BACL|nr:EamA family transporter [Paenibacillus cremeus]TVY09779.1 EamA family transporter [Paenibacillus cremeus]